VWQFQYQAICSQLGKHIATHSRSKAAMLSDKTLAIIKPDVSPQQADEIMQLIELKGFTIITKSYRQVGTAAGFQQTPLHHVPV
jgi:hypothetical protein